MARGALIDSDAQVVVATTGVAGPGETDGTPPGTICFGWGFNLQQNIEVITETQRFKGNRSNVLTIAAQ